MKIAIRGLSVIQNITPVKSSLKSKLVAFVALLSLSGGHATAQSLSQDGDLRQLRPDDWVAGLPDKGKESYLVTQAAQRGPTRIEALRHWLSLWTKSLSDPNLTLVELDYVKYVIEYRDPLIVKALEEARRRDGRIAKPEWGGNIQVAMTRKASDLTSMENKLASMRVRSGRQAKLAILIGEHVELITKERTEMKEIVDYYKDLCRRYRWYYGWHTFWYW